MTVTAEAMARARALMTGRAPRALLRRTGHVLVDRLPLHTTRRIARNLVRRGDAARDAGRYQVAAALYGEALRFAPTDGRAHVQCGHMLKEAGDLAGAERHYLAALRLMPDDPDLALQLGHFYKVAGRPDEAQAAYARALTLRPGWATAADELGRLGAYSPVPAGDAPVPELLPRPADAEPPTPANGVRIFRLGARRVPNRWGLKVMRGVEAIRGACIATTPVRTVELLLEGAVVRTGGVHGAALPHAAPGQTRHVFNLWHDFSDVPRGRIRLELRFLDAAGRRVAVWRDTVLVDAPLTEADHPFSDAVVTPPPGDLDAGIDARPSMVRPARRSVLDGPVRTVLVQRFDQLGDVVVSVPALRRLRALLPDARIVGLLGPANADLAASLGLFDEIIVFDLPEDPVEGRRVMTAAQQHALRERLAPYRFDVAIDLIDNDASRALLRLSGARFLYGFNAQETPWLSAGLQTASRDPMNEIENAPVSGKLLTLVERLGGLLVSPAQVVRRPELDRALLAPLGLDGSPGYVVLHTGARVVFSRWPHFAALTRMFLERTGLTVAILAEDMADVGLPADLAASPRVVPVVGRMPFDRFDALVSHAALFIGNDSGPKHLAGLRGVPTISLHMARLNWNEWGQEGDGLIISRRVPCAGCAIRDPDECGREFVCMRRIMPEEVMAASLALLGDRAQPDGSAASRDRHSPDPG